MKAFIMQPHYLPWAGLFDMVDQSDIFVYYDDVQFITKSWQKRNRIKTPFGVKWVSLSVDRDTSSRSLIKDVRINYDERWVDKNLNQIREAYRKSPFFEETYACLKDIMKAGYQTVADLNIAMTNTLMRQLGIKIPTLASSTLGTTGSGMGKVVNTLRQVGADQFLDGATGHEVNDPHYYAEHGIEIYFHQYEHPVYRQLHGPFKSHLSTIDLLFNEGPDALRILRSGRTGEEPALRPA
jgi:hypothetical protein